MRLSSTQIFQQGISAILNQQAKLQQTEQQLATGKRLLTPSDDPAAAVQALAISESLKRTDQYQNNGAVAQNQLAREESVLADVGNVLVRARELVVQANNASQSPETRGSIGKEISASIDELRALSNTRDANGEYIFAGFQTRTEPFVIQGNVTSYQGDNGQRMLQLAQSTQVAVRDSGFDVFMSVPSGNGVFDVKADSANSGTGVVGSNSVSGAFIPDTYSIVFSQPTPTDPVTYEVLDASSSVIVSGNYLAGEAIEFAGALVKIEGTPADGDNFEVTPSVQTDIFSTLQGIADQMESVTSDPAQIAIFNSEMGRALDNIDQALNHVLDVRVDVGVRLGRVESQLDINDSFNLQLQETLSEIQDLDYAEAISRFNLQLTSLQAAQQSYVKMQGLSLFNYL